jgi:tetratricopeptide (TPR) repeat protein
MKPRTILSVPMITLLLFAIAAPAQAQTAIPQQTLNQYVSNLQHSPNDTALREKIIAFVQTMKPAPAIPEEARGHYVMAARFMEKAKDNTGFERAVVEYKAALLAAPWWAEGYKNLAIAQKAADQYDDAIASLNLYLASQPADARDAQDEIYKLTADKQAAAQAPVQAVAEQQQRRQREEQRRALEAQRVAKAENDSIAGRWKFQGGNVFDAASHWEFHIEGSVLVAEVVFDQGIDNFRAGQRQVHAQYRKIGDRRFETWNDMMRASITLEFNGDMLAQTISGGATTFFRRLP